jgi:RNA polymerase sigma factor (sigma-70 family)
VTSDSELLRLYAEEHSDAALAKLVERHIAVVYHAALRRLDGDAAAAADVTQLVFTDLARKAGQLRRHSAIIAWLFSATHFAAAKHRRAEQTRHKYEEEAHTMHELQREDTSAAEWDRLRPAVDDALASLNDTDRAAVILRFFEGRSFGEIGTALAVREDAARMRVDRALTKLQAIFKRRGIDSTATALGLALATQATAAVPLGLAGTITTAAVAGVALSGGTVAAITFMSTLKIAAGVALVAAAGIGVTGYYRANATARETSAQVQHLNESIAQLRSENAALVDKSRASQAEADRLRAELAAARTPAAIAKPVVASKPDASVSTRPFTLLAGLKPAESFANAGRATPKAAFETMSWATTGGDVAVITEMMVLPADTRQKLESLFASLPEEARAKYGSSEQLLAALLANTTPAAGAQVMTERSGIHATGYDPALTNDPNYRTLHTQTQYNDGRVREGDTVLQQMPDGWHVVYPSWLIDKLGEMLKPKPANFKHDGGG